MEEVMFRAHEASIKFGAKVIIKKDGEKAKYFLQHGNRKPVLHGSIPSPLTEEELIEEYERASRRFVRRFC